MAEDHTEYGDAAERNRGSLWARFRTCPPGLLAILRTLLHKEVDDAYNRAVLDGVEERSDDGDGSTDGTPEERPPGGA